MRRRRLIDASGRPLNFTVRVRVRLVTFAFASASILVAGAAIAKCASVSTAERYSEAQTVALVEIIDARDGPVPWPYGLWKGAVPGRLLKLRVLKSWKGSLHPEDITFGWAHSPKIEDAYSRTEVGTQIIVFYSKDSAHEIWGCSAAPPDRLNETSEELDALVLGTGRADPNKRWSGP